MLGTGKKKGESWNRREGQTEEENRPWWMAKLSSKGKGIQVSKVGPSNTGRAGECNFFPVSSIPDTGLTPGLGNPMGRKFRWLQWHQGL